MANNCVVCCEAVRTKASGTSCDGTCGNWYHYKCHNTTEKSNTIPRADAGKHWTCARCAGVQSSQPRPPPPRLSFNLGAAAVTRSADNTPLGSPSATGAFSISVDAGNALTKLQQNMQTVLNSLTTIQVTLTQVQEGQVQLKTTQERMNETLEFCTGKIQDFDKKLQEHDSHLAEHDKKLEIITPELHMLRKEVSQLQVQMDDANQRAFADAVEIKGVPDSAANQAIVISIASAVKSSLKPEDILEVRCVSSKSVPPQKQVRVRFTSKEARDELLKCVRVKKRLSCKDIGLDSGESPVYVNELLTNKKKRLLSIAKDYAKKNSIKYVFVSGGQIFMRKDIKEPSFLIKSEEDIANICFRK